MATNEGDQILSFGRGDSALGKSALLRNRHMTRTIGGEHMVVRALKEASADWIQDWSSMVRLILWDFDGEKGKIPAELSDAEERTLVYIFCVSVKSLATGLPPERINIRGLPPLKKSEIRKDFESPATLKETYSKLLEKFRFDEDKIIALIQLLPYLNFHAELPENATAVRSLWENLDAVFFNTNSIELLKEICSFVCYFVRTVEDSFETSLSSFIESTFFEQAYFDAMDKLLEWFSVDGSEGAREESYLSPGLSDYVVVLKRLYAATYCDSDAINATEIWVLVKKFLAQVVNSDGTEPAEMVEFAAGAYCKKLRWILSHLPEQDTEGIEAKLKDDIEGFVAILMAIFGSGFTEYEILVYPVLCDAVVLMACLGLPERIEERFQMINKAVLEDQLFTKSADGQYLYGTKEQREEIFAAFVRVVIHEALPVAHTLPIYHHFTKNRDDFGKPFKILLEESKKKDEEACLLVIFTSLSTAYFELGSSLDESKEMAKDLAEIFGCSQKQETALQLHTFAFRLFMQHVEHDEALDFVDIISVFIANMRPLSSKDLTEYLRTNVDAGRTATRRHIDKYMRRVQPYLRGKQKHVDSPARVASASRRKVPVKDSVGAEKRTPAKRPARSRRGRKK